MAKILGLDLGTNSIGWAIIENDHNKILGMGSRIFPVGVNEFGQGEKELSKNASRTIARSTRRQFFRRRLRKIYLLKILAKHSLCPLGTNEIKSYEPQIFTNKKLVEWFRLNPYELRAKALKNKIELEELGRIFYHMIQRRGFQSNSRSAGKEDGKIYDGNPKEGKAGILETQRELNGKTLGAALYDIYPKEGKPFINQLKRIRNRYTTRQMYIDEFEAIWESQKQYHKELTEQLKTLIGGRKKEGYPDDGVLFFQRPLRSQKHLIGNCTFEPKKTKCPKSAIPFELFRIYQWVNTVEYNGKKLSPEERDIVVKLLLSKDKIAFKLIRKALNRLDSYYQFNYKDEDKIVGSYTISHLSNKKFFGSRWFEFSEKEQEDIWHVLFFFEDKDKLKQYAKTKWGFNEEKAEGISKFHLKDGYANLSRKAINNILPFLKKGYTYDAAAVLGGVKNAFGKKWQPLNDEQIQFIEDNIISIISVKYSGGFIEKVKEFLTDEFNLTEKELKKLYHHSANIGTRKILNKLPVGTEADKEIQNIRNPIVVTALFELRKLVNEIIELYGKPDEIKIELARDLKISKTERRKVRLEQQRLEKENDRIKAELDAIGQNHTHENILKYKLWEECNRTCPYTGRKINIRQLFSGEVQIEHIQSWSKSLNDSFNNKTLCFADENRAKGDKTPYEYYFKDFGPEKWELVKAQALSCFKNKEHYPNAYNKFKHFVKQSYDSDFINRQLNDTRYISREAKTYLSKICDKVMVAPGQMTANLRHKWGLNSILNNDNNKSRDDHRHHAIDALVMACSTVSHLQELSRWNRYRRSAELKSFPMPWDGFLEEARQTVNCVLVSHKKSDRILTSKNHTTKKNGQVFKNKGIAARGHLHKETVYGKRKAPGEEEYAFHVRKPIEALSTRKQIEKIVDPTIRKIILERVKKLGGFEKDDKIPHETFFSLDEKGRKQPQIFLPNKNGDPVPVKKVRLREHKRNLVNLKENVNQFVDLQNNHHVLIYKDREGHLKEDVVTFWSAVKRKMQGEDVFQLPQDGVQIVTTLQINDMFLLGFNKEDINWNNPDLEFLERHLYRVQKLSSKFYEFRLNSEAQLDKNYAPYYIRIQSFGDGKTGWNTFNPIKVKLTPAGRIEPLKQ